MAVWDSLDPEKVMNGLLIAIGSLLATIATRAGWNKGGPAESPKIEVMGDVVVIENLRMMITELGALQGVILSQKKVDEEILKILIKLEEILTDQVHTEGALKEALKELLNEMRYGDKR